MSEVDGVLSMERGPCETLFLKHLAMKGDGVGEAADSNLAVLTLQDGGSFNDNTVGDNSFNNDGVSTKDRQTPSFHLVTIWQINLHCSITSVISKSR